MMVASGNRGKLAELTLLLGERFGPVCGPPPGLHIDEDAPTFGGNAAKKVLGLAALLAERGLPRHEHLLADGSGLEVVVLGMRPGVRSARLGADEARRLGTAAPEDADAGCRAALLALLAQTPPEGRAARLCCALALLPPDATTPSLYVGELDGHIALAARGSEGFGYDSLFVPRGENKTLAELGAAYKNRVSHRRRAIAEMLAQSHLE